MSDQWIAASNRFFAKLMECDFEGVVHSVCSVAVRNTVLRCGRGGTLIVSWEGAHCMVVSMKASSCPLVVMETGTCVWRSVPRHILCRTSHTQTYNRTQASARAHAHTGLCVFCVLSLATCYRAERHTRTCARTRTHTNTRSRTHTHTQARTHTSLLAFLPYRAVT